MQQSFKSCHLLFSLADIKSKVEIWRDIHANNVLVALHEVFDDFHLDTSKIQLSCHEEDTVTCIDSDWVDIRYDSSLLDIASSRLYENKDLTVDDADTSQNCGTELTLVLCLNLWPWNHRNSLIIILRIPHIKIAQRMVWWTLFTLD